MTLALLLMCYGTAVFAVRGVSRGAKDSGDFATLFAATRAWVHGANPYERENVVHEWDAAGGEAKATPDWHATPSVYPPTTFLVLCPWALLSWSTARILWLAVSVGSIILGLISLCRVSQSDSDLPRSLGFVGLSLSLYPLSTGVSKGNPAVIATSFLILSVILALTRRQIVGGLLLAIALALKPQLAAPFFLYHAMERRWRLVFAAGLIFCAIAVIATIRTNSIASGWRADWLAKVHTTTEPGGINDISESNPYRFQAINLAVLTEAVTRSPRLANVFNAVFSSLALLILLLSDRFRNRAESRWLFASAIAVFCLLPVYHRFYDASLLIFPLYWAFFHVPSGSRSAMTVVPVVLLILPFVLPGAVLLSNLVDTHRVATSVATSYWWNAFVMPHQVWALVGLYACLVWRFARSQQTVVP